MALDIPVNTQCPACKSTDFAPVDPFRMKQKGAGVLADDYTVQECHNCGLWFKDRFPSQDALTQYYEGLSLSEDQWIYEGRLPHEKRLDKLFAELPKGAKVLDVGCWTGRLLTPHMHLHRFGIEPNHASAVVAEKNGIHIIAATATNETLSGHKFDLITMIDVFEHLSNPFEVIQILTSHLKKDGKLVFMTGRTNSFPIKLTHTSYWYFSIIPDHIVFLNKKFTDWLKTQLPVASVSVKAMRHYPFILKKYLKELAWLIIWRYGNPNSPFGAKGIFKLPIFKRFGNLKEIIICTNWKDHYFVTIKK